MVPRPLLPLLAFCTLIVSTFAASGPGRTGGTDRPQAPAYVDKNISVEVLTPDGAWVLSIEEVRLVQQELWVFAKVERPDGAIGAMMVSAASDQITGRFPDLPIKTFVVGKNWKWANEEPVTWVSSSDSFERRRQGQRLWRR